MGAKNTMLAYVTGRADEILQSHPQLDREASSALATRLFPSEKLVPLADGDLYSTYPPEDELVVGCFPGLSIVAAKEFGIDYPSELDRRFLRAVPARRVILHAMHSVVDWFAYAIWTDGQLTRSLSLSPDSGVLENIGPMLAFEEPYWGGRHPVFDPEEDEEDDYPFPFHPLELGEAALFELFGYYLEGLLDGPRSAVRPEDIPLARFKRSRRRVDPAP